MQLYARAACVAALGHVTADADCEGELDSVEVDCEGVAQAGTTGCDDDHTSSSRKRARERSREIVACARTAKPGLVLRLLKLVLFRGQTRSRSGRRKNRDFFFKAFEGRKKMGTGKKTRERAPLSHFLSLSQATRRGSR